MEFQKVTGMISWIWMRSEQNTEQENQQATDKKVEFQQDKHSEASEFHIMGWGYYKWNNNALFLKY